MRCVLALCERHDCGGQSGLICGVLLRDVSRMYPACQWCVRTSRTKRHKL